jgi:lactoylglutathione lyase
MFLNLLVIKAKNPDRLVQFYQALGMRFSKERHGNGPEHYACEMDNAVFEIYPLVSESDNTRGTRLGFVVDSIANTFLEIERAFVHVNGKIVNSKNRKKAILEDPEGHKIELLERAPVILVSSPIPVEFDTHHDAIGNHMLEPQA